MSDTPLSQNNTDGNLPESRDQSPPQKDVAWLQNQIHPHLANSHPDFAVDQSHSRETPHIETLSSLPHSEKVQSPQNYTPEDLAKSISSKLQQQADSLDIAEKTSHALPQKPVHKNASLVQQIRTFKGDVADVVESKNISVIDIVAAEQDKKSTSDHVTNKNAVSIASVALLVGTLLFIIGGGSALVFVILTNQTLRAISITKITPTIVLAEKTTLAPIAVRERNAIQAVLVKIRDSANPPLGTLEQIKLIDEGPRSTTLTSSDFLEAIGSRADPAFIRSLKPDMMIGVHSATNVVPFLLFKTSSYEQAFAGMLKWESAVADDLSPFLPRKNIARAEQFTDAVIRNKDARILRNSDGSIAYLYSFPDRETLVITTSEQTLIEIATRLSNTRVIKN